MLTLSYQESTISKHRRRNKLCGIRKDVFAIGCGVLAVASVTLGLVSYLKTLKKDNNKKGEGEKDER